MLTCQQHGNGIRHRAEILLFFDKLLEIVEAVWIEQAQTGEMAFKTELLRGCGQQQHPRHLGRQLFNRQILAAGRGFAPDQMVSFIHHQQIPFCFTQVFQTLLVAANEIQRADH